MTDSGMTMADWVVDGAVRPDFASRRPTTVASTSSTWPRATARIIDDGIRFTNGIAFGPDGDLYVTEMISGDIFRYRFSAPARWADASTSPTS